MCSLSGEVWTFKTEWPSSCMLTQVFERGLQSFWGALMKDQGYQSRETIKYHMLSLWTWVL